MTLLAAYHRKRRFDKTPEPKGRGQGTENRLQGPLTFVVQKHQASSLHYDFRLELDGVLKSWAVPKGPSMNPKDKRLAIMVEDHPIEYAKFEGIIPKDNYGAGTVMIWDSGVYTPLDTVDRAQAEKDLKSQLQKGHLTFVLLGQKLKGEFALVKTKQSSDSWLLIKKGDEYASKKDILKSDQSVQTGRSMDQISSKSEAEHKVWDEGSAGLDLESAPKSKFPHQIKPMLATPSQTAFDKKGWIYEIKWDGYRAISEIESGKVKLYSRNGLDFKDKFAPVVKSLTKFGRDVVLDGEVVMLESSGQPNFGLLQDYPKTAHQGELFYYVFDILYLDGHDLTKLPLVKRKQILQTVMPHLPYLSYSDHVNEAGESFFKHAQKLKLEGVMAKDGQSIYQTGVRSQDWLKIKTHLEQEAIICGFTAPKGGRKYFGALVLGVYEGKKLKYIGHTGGGFDDDKLKTLYSKLNDLETKDSPFDQKIQTNGPVTWVKPKLVCQVKFSAWTKDHQMRQPIFISLRDDKAVSEVRDESLEVGRKTADPEDDKILKIGHRTVKVTNLDKIFWPQEKYTKSDLVKYYQEIAPILLPYLKNRPQSLKRYPNGIKGESFFQKDVSNLNLEWLSRVSLESNHKRVEFMLCQDEASLIYMINLGCIDLNPWNSTVMHPEKPDYLVIDLDPEAVSFATVVKVAQTARQVLENLEIPSYPKTSGASGIHIYIPTAAKYDYEQVRQFANLLCIQIHQKIPHMTSLIRNPKDRQGKVYLDWLQNARGQTLASVYSVRPEPKAPVSTPLDWSELTADLKPQDFNIKNTLKRLNRKGDLFKPVLAKGVDIKKVLKRLEKLS